MKLLDIQIFKYIILYTPIIILLTQPYSLAQIDELGKIPEKKKFSFGNYWFLNVDHKAREGNLDFAGEKYITDGIVYGDSVFVKSNSTIYSDLLKKLLKANEIKTIFLTNNNIHFV